MIINFSKNKFSQVIGVIFWNRNALFFFALCSATAFFTCVYFKQDYLCLPPIPVSILGGALAIFLGFRNSSAYDRWWEARKIWGAVVNDSRSLGLEVLSYPIPNSEEDKAEIEAWQKRVLHRHIAWLYALNGHLRKEKIDLTAYMSKEEIASVSRKNNIPAQIIVQQGADMRLAFQKNWFAEYRFNSLTGTLKKFYDDQGKAERIKNTVFPFYYNYFTRFFLYLFTMTLPFALVSVQPNWVMIPISVLISFAFFILNKSGEITETPFEGRAADTPISTICRGIEIDLLQMLDADDVPGGLPVDTGKFGVQFQR